MNSEKANCVEPFKRTAKAFVGLASICCQTLAVEDYAALAILGLFMGLLYWSLLFPIFFPLVLFFKPEIGIWFLLPFCWAYYDRNTPIRGGRKSKWFCNLKIFDSYRKYFSTRLIKTADLPSGRNYLLAHYPHSVVPFNILPNFLSDLNKVTDIFPELEMRYVTHDVIFSTPLVRDFVLAIGGCSCSESSLRYLLNSEPSKGIIVVPGGAAEIRYATQGSLYTIVTSKRKGFVRLALTTGTPLVPVFTFGEINTWSKLIVLPLSKTIKWIINLVIKHPSDLFIPVGRGFLLNFGFLPKKIPVNTIVGAPILVPRVENPPGELIDAYHDKFFQALRDLFEKHKYEYDIAGTEAKLVML